MYVLAIDIGTEGIRVGLVDTHGKVVGSASSSYKTDYPHPSWAEQAPEDWWQAAAQATRACLANSRVVPAEIQAIGLDAFASTMVVCDRNAQPLRPAILWMDGRASLEAEEIERTGDAVLKYGGGHESVEWMLPRLLWLKRNQPDVYARAERIVEALDWFTYRLTERWTSLHQPGHRLMALRALAGRLAAQPAENDWLGKLAPQISRAHLRHRRWGWRIDRAGSRASRSGAGHTGRLRRR